MLYLLRHGEAEDPDGDDAARRLTAKGQRQGRAAGRALARLGAKIDACLTSPRLRAAETARLASGPLGLEPETASELRGGAFDAPGLAPAAATSSWSGTSPTSPKRSPASPAPTCACARAAWR
jgi:phosphohistidine phosphatase SixA